MVVSDRVQKIVDAVTVDGDLFVGTNTPGWSMVSNGWFLVAWPEDIDWAGTPGPDPKRQELYTSGCARVLSSWPDSLTGRTSLSSIAALGFVVRPDCTDCDGTGEHDCAGCDGEGSADCICTCGDDHTAECEDCDGEGNVPCRCGDTRGKYCVVAGTVFNRLLLGAVCQLLPEGQAEIMVAPLAWQKDPDAGLYLVSGGVRALLMSARVSLSVDMPTLDVEAAQ
jgi:hypothetical protein